MSEIAILSSIFIFLFLSSHACNARNLRLVDDESTSTSKIVGSTTMKMKMDFSADKGTSRDVNVLRSQDEDPAAAATQELKKSSKIPNEEAKNVKEDKESSAGVSWRVPEKSSSHGEHPGFNSDYSQPRTRTPCHN